MGLEGSLAGNLSGSLAGDLADAGVPLAEELDALLGGKLREVWDARFGYTLDGTTIVSWAGQKLGLVIDADAAADQPTFAADGANFMGRPVVQCATPDAGDYLIERDFGLDLHASGARPHVAVVSRFRQVNGGYNLFQHIDAVPRVYIVGNGSLTPVTFDYRSVWELTTASSATEDTSPHLFEFYLTAAGEVAIAIDGGAPVLSGSGVSLSEAVRGLSIGNDQVAFIGEVNIAAVLELTSELSAGERTALHTWATDNWGTP